METSDLIRRAQSLPRLGQGYCKGMDGLTLSHAC